MSDREDFEKWAASEGYDRYVNKEILWHAFLAGRKPPEGWNLVPQPVFDALIAWTGAEPSQSILARALEEWGGPGGTY